MRTEFKETEQRFDLSGFQMKRTDEELFKSNYAMMNIRQLKFYLDSFNVKGDSNRISAYTDLALISKNYRLDTLNKKLSAKPMKVYKDVLNLIPVDKRIQSLQTAKDQIRSVKDVLIRKELFEKDNDSRLRGFLIELNRKFTIAFSCIVLFFIGAPLGAIIRKGGLGLPVVMSVLFFLIYHIISTIGEKSVKEGSLSPFLGMWIAIICLSPLGIFLTYKASVDSVLFDIEIYKRWFKRLFSKKDEQAA
jgi:lipopolysaccharide export system permease protein